MEARLKQWLAADKAAGLARVRRLRQLSHGAFAKSAHHTFYHFAGNDYLGLSTHPKVVGAMAQSAKAFGVGATSSAAVCGDTVLHEQFEGELAEFLGYPSVMLFPTGYMANLGVIGSLFERGDHLFLDKHCHASMVDGVKLSGAQFFRFKHNDMDHLRRRLQNHPATVSAILTEGVFSMSGDVPPLKQMTAFAKQTQSISLLDDSHGLGVVGERGRGSVQAQDLSAEDVPLITSGMGKAFGGSGGFVAGNTLTIDALRQFARSYRYTTSLSPAMLAAMRQSLHLMAEGALHGKLWQNIKYFDSCATSLALPILPSQSAIKCILVGTPEQGQDVFEKLWQAGFWVGLMRPPTVPPGTTRLRIGLTARHQPSHIAHLLETLAKILTNTTLQSTLQAVEAADVA